MNENYQANQVHKLPRTLSGEVEKWCWHLGCYGLICVLLFVFRRVVGAYDVFALPFQLGVCLLVYLIYRVLYWTYSYKEIQKANTLQREGQLIEAFVVNRWTIYDSESGTSYALAYQPPGGVLTVHYMNWEGPPLGSRILVLYAPSNPVWSKVVSDSSSFQLLRAQRTKLFTRQRLGDWWGDLRDDAIGEQLALPASVVPESKKDYASSS